MNDSVGMDMLQSQTYLDEHFPYLCLWNIKMYSKSTDILPQISLFTVLHNYEELRVLDEGVHVSHNVRMVNVSE